MRDVIAVAHGRIGWSAPVPFARAEMNLADWSEFRDHHCIQQLLQLRHIMPVGPAHDEGQRDATPVHEQADLASIFPPGPWGSDPQLPGRAGPCPGSVHAQPLPGNAFHIVVLRQANPPEVGKESSPVPFLEIGVDGARTAIDFLGQSLPLNPGPNDIDDGLEYLPGGPWARP